MTTLPPHCVIDASVLIKFVIPEADTPTVRRLLCELLTDDEATIYAPDLLFIECANVLWKKVQRGECDARTAEESLEDLAALELDTTPTPDLTARALKLACDHQITAYDAAYVALAERLGAPLLTADDRLGRKLGGTGVIVIDLGRYLAG